MNRENNEVVALPVDDSHTDAEKIKLFIVEPEQIERDSRIQRIRQHIGGLFDYEKDKSRHDGWKHP